VSDTAEWVDVLATGDLADAVLTPADLDGEGILLFRTGDRIFAIGARCSHAGMSLEHARVKGDGDDAILTCPAHGSQFRVADGRVLRPPAQRPLASYDARDVDGRVQVRPR
jgi:nitrite reductase/ring-hydroxylating ferredoxin subunit